MRPRGRLVSALTVTLILLVMANSVVWYGRIDLTERGLHTLTQTTREMLDRLEDEVTITYYVSDLLTERYPRIRDAVDLLLEYEAAARGRVRIRQTSPDTLDNPQSVEELGVIPQQLRITNAGETRLAVVYSGLVVEQLDRRETIPFVFGAQTLEYELTTAISDLVRDDARDLAIVLGDPLDRLEEDYRLVATELSRSYEVRLLNPGEAIPDDVDVALLVDAHRLTTAELAPARSYLERGGALLLTLERYEVDLSRGFSARRTDPAAVFDFIRELGMEVGTGMLLDREHNSIPVEELAGDVRVTRAYPYAHWPVTLEQYTDPEHPVTARHPGLDLAWPTWIAAGTQAPGEVREQAGDRYESQTIAGSTPGAWTMQDPVVIDPQQQERLMRDADRTAGQRGLVAVARSRRVSGARVAVVADADFLRDVYLQATGSRYNLDFVTNLAQWLSNDVGLLGIRARGAGERGLDAIAEPRRERTVVFLARAVNLVLVPSAVALVGVVRLGRRRRGGAARGRGRTGGGPRRQR